ncbi:hypothetical protein C8F04DRAFT_1192239 [Mycena alexandri]|uniref:Uncharacterized protein n=1 Tax=Mycena alexandri TaxID=1745969 RepID=A0AAD6WX94_9AGAR|nr:hypothetical protein C8F04DRAFT_1192239 [Mycena alexandri]
MPAPTRDFEIVRSASWWKDFHERKRRWKEREEAAKRPRLDLAPGQQQGPLVTFVPGRSAPIISVVQNDGTLLAKPSAEGHVACAKPMVIMGSSGCSPHTPLAGGPGPSKEARAIMARVGAKRRDPETILLEQLAGFHQRANETSEQSSRRPGKTALQTKSKAHSAE